MDNRREYLTNLFLNAVTVSQPKNCLSQFLQQFSEDKPICILGAGKAAADMASVCFDYFGNHCFGAVVTRYGYETDKPCGNIKVLSASHPVPDHNSHQAGLILLDIAKNVDPSIPVLFLISGGGSALACVPPDNVSLEQKLSVHHFLLRSGAEIEEMNTVRKQLSLIKGGRLAAACPAKTITAVISDVVGDDPSFIASGMTVQDQTTPEQAIDILYKYGWDPVSSIYEHLQKNNTPPNVVTDYQIIANAQQAIEAARKAAQKDNWVVDVISLDEIGEAREVAQKHAALALEYKRNNKPIILLSGGELTVTLGDSNGDGGPNQEYLMALAIALNGESGICALAADTDGVDGSRDVAGGYIDEYTLIKADKCQLNPHQLLTNHQSYQFFHNIGEHIITGPTRTNVNDFRAIMIS